MLLTWRKNKSTFKAVFFIHLTFGHCQLLPPGKGEEEHENYIFSVKNGITIKNLFWANIVPKIMSSLSSGCNISIRAYYLQVCYFITRLSEIFRTPLLLRKTLEKCYCLLERYCMVLRLFSLIVPSSHVITTPVCGIRR